MKWFERRPPVVPPTNVRVVTTDGEVIPLECVYRGWNGTVHEWVVAWALPALPAQILVDELPAGTGVTLELKT